MTALKQRRPEHGRKRTKTRVPETQQRKRLRRQPPRTARNGEKEKKRLQSISPRSWYVQPARRRRSCRKTLLADSFCPLSAVSFLWNTGVRKRMYRPTNTSERCCTEIAGGRTSVTCWTPLCRSGFRGYAAAVAAATGARTLCYGDGGAHVQREWKRDRDCRGSVRFVLLVPSSVGDRLYLEDPTRPGALFFFFPSAPGTRVRQARVQRLVERFFMGNGGGGIRIVPIYNCTGGKEQMTFFFFSLVH